MTRRDLTDWAVLFKASAWEKEIWARRNVRTFDMTIDEFVDETEKP